jgi:hypothetical protein
LSDQVGVGKAPTRLDDPHGYLGSPVKISAAEVLEHLVAKKVPTFDDVCGLGLEQSLRSSDPAPSNRELSSDVQQYAKP